VTLWRAANPRTRDFRLQTIGRAFTSTPLKDVGDGTYVARPARLKHGYAASFVELTYRTQRDEPFTVTTSVAITPDVLPFPSPAGS
jgi:PhoPQ-activated pathogenicity-related protein